ncbi:MAG: SLBB domain-containing protein [Edaphocola sp.]
MLASCVAGWSQQTQKTGNQTQQSSNNGNQSSGTNSGSATQNGNATSGTPTGQTNSQNATQQGGSTVPDPSKMSADELRNYIKELRGGEQKKQNSNTADTDKGIYKKDRDTANEDAKTENEIKAENRSGTRLPIFGNEFFNGSKGDFAPNPNKPTPIGYVLGPGDELNIDVTGNSVVSWSVVIQPDGSISLPGMGKLYLSGKTIEAGHRAIEAKLKANRFEIGAGTSVSVTLTNIRSIRITMIGEVNSPGDKNVTSLTTVFNALYNAGGITKNGSYRAIEVIRDNEIIANIDMYKFLVNGDLGDDILLKDGDVIRVPLYRVRVSMQGETKRNAYFEVLPGETLRDVVNFAGGFSDYAYKHLIKAVQLTDKEQRLQDISMNEIDNYVPLKGDRYFVERILDRYENRVVIQGSVYRPGEYELTDGMTLKELLARIDGLKEDAYLNRAYIARLNENNTTEIIPFDLGAVTAGKAADILLKKEDVISIGSIFDYGDTLGVAINGAVRRGGSFAFYEGLTAEDLILAAGGFADGANKTKIMVSRRVKDSDRLSKDAKLAQFIDVTIDPELKLENAKFKLEPFDVVSVFKLPGYVSSMQVVTVNGEVMNPGGYTILKKNDRISDILNRVGGFTAYANLKDATFNRGGRVGNIDVASIIKHPGGNKDIILMGGDTITIPGINQLIRVSGAVQMPMPLVYESSSLMENVYKAGGFAENARKKGAYVMYANGSVKGTKHFLFFRNYPRVEPGSEIVIPIEQPKEDNDRALRLAQTFIGLTGSLASVAAIIFAMAANN